MPMLDLYSTKQRPGQGLLEFIQSRQDLYAKNSRAKYPIQEVAAVQTTLRKLRGEFITFADQALNGPPRTTVSTFDVLITKAEQLQGIAENANEISASETRLTALETQLADAHRQIKAINGINGTNHVRKNNFRGRGHGHSGGRGRRNKNPPNPCKFCGGNHWNADCPHSKMEPHMVSTCELHAVDAVMSPSTDMRIYLDSAASHSFTPHGHLLHDYRPVQGVSCRFAGHSASAGVLGVGSLLLRARNNQSIKLQSVYHIADLRHTLVGVIKCAESGVYSHFDQKDGSGSVAPYTERHRMRTFLSSHYPLALHSGFSDRAGLEALRSTSNAQWARCQLLCMVAAATLLL
jgi:hypothetical protein